MYVCVHKCVEAGEQHRVPCSVLLSFITFIQGFSHLELGQKLASPRIFPLPLPGLEDGVGGLYMDVGDSKSTPQVSVAHTLTHTAIYLA